MDTKELFAHTIQQSSICVSRVTSDDLGNSTPCTEWDLGTLLNHMVYELLWLPDITLEKNAALNPDIHKGDVLGSDFHAAWNRAADTALVAVKRARYAVPAHLTYGDVSMDDYIKEVSSDILVHTWDVAQSMFYTLLIEPALARTVYNISLPKKDMMIASGLFAPPIDVSDDWPLQDKLLALFGRKALA